MVKKNENAFKFKGNGIQFDLNSDLIDNLERAQHYLELKKISRASALIDDSLKALRERNKLISIADKSDGGWNTVQEYLSNEKSN
jgi:predicted urease superfamily metal-dependent hydrolase